MSDRRYPFRAPCIQQNKPISGAFRDPNKSPSPELGGGLGWGKRAKIPSGGNAASPSLPSPNLGEEFQCDRPIAALVSPGILVMSQTGAIGPPHRPIFGQHYQWGCRQW